MTTLKRCISVIVAIAMLFSMSAIPVLATDEAAAVETDVISDTITEGQLEAESGGIITVDGAVEIAQQTEGVTDNTDAAENADSSENVEDITSDELPAETENTGEHPENAEQTESSAADEEESISESEASADEEKSSSVPAEAEIQLMSADVALMSETTLEGLGTEESPYLIYTEDELIALATGTIANALSAYYQLQNDITLTAETWTPIGAETVFSGSFDGNGHTITAGDLFQSTGLSGFFGKNIGSIKNVNIVASITDTAADAGLLVGTNSGTIENCSSSGTIATNSNINIGGLVGYNSGIISGSWSDAIVTGKNASVGGLVGYNSGTVADCYSLSEVTAGNGNTGGLIGYNYNGNISGCYAKGTVTATGYAGGLIGYSRLEKISDVSTITKSYATGDVAGNIAGGLVGCVFSYIDSMGVSIINTIDYCYAQGVVNGSQYGGGLIGQAITDRKYTSQIEPINYVMYCYATGVVNEGEGGGLLGEGFTYKDDYNYTRYCYYNSKNDGNTIGFAASASRMKTQALYYGWDFENYWSLSDESIYPYLNLSGSNRSMILEGKGTVDAPYVITDEMQLFALSSGELSREVHYKLANDIAVTARNWTPIGSNGTSAFSGSLDGCGYTISGIKLSNSSYDYVGLFGNNSGTLKNLNIVVDFDGEYYTGGLTAYNSGIIENCTVSGTVTGNGNRCDYTGGIAACNIGKILNSDSSATVIAETDYAGGITGYSSGIIKGCSSSSDVTASNGSAGGLVGHNYNGTVEKSYSTGSVTATNYAGGLIANSYLESAYDVDIVSVTTSYATGMVVGNISGGLIGYICSYVSNGGVSIVNAIKYCYSHSAVIGNQYGGGLIGQAITDRKYTSQVEPINYVMYCYATGVVNEGEGGGLVGNGYIYEDNLDYIRYCYYNSKNGGNKIGFALSASKLKSQSNYYGWDFENIWSLENSTFPYVNVRGIYGGVEIEGFGDDDDPYIIENEQQLIAIFNGEIGPSQKAYYELANDITITTAHWTPIGGNGTNPFNGVFDGKGYTISGIKLKNSHYDYIGFFGHNSGIIKNLNLVVDFDGECYVGGLAGKNSGTIDNCTVNGVVTSVGTRAKYVGGLVGSNIGDISNSVSNVTVTAENSYAGGLVGYNSGEIVSSHSSLTVNAEYGSAGGLVGYNYNGTIESSYATGAVTALEYAGGLVGYSYLEKTVDTDISTVTTSYSTGDVKGNVAGGLIGHVRSYVADGGISIVNAIDYCYSHSAVTGGKYAGGLIGEIVTDKRYTSQVEPINYVMYCYATGVVNDGKGCGLIGNGYIYEDNLDYIRYCYYNSVNIGNKIGFEVTNAKLMQKDTYYGWNFENDWSIEENQFPIINKRGTYYGIDIEGAGDDDDPYIIENEQQLIAIFNGEIGPSQKAYYELANDITITTTHWTPIGENGTNPFNGVFDGKGHTISGIKLKNSHYDYIGFFGHNSGTIKNLNLIVDIEGECYVGGLAGKNSGTIDNCTVNGLVVSVGSRAKYTGGLVGSNIGNIINSESSASVTADYNYVGGISGYNSGNISNCVSKSNVITTNGSAGGLIGCNYNGTVAISYATGSVTSTGYAGGLIGYSYLEKAVNTDLVTVTESYATGNVTGKISGGLIGCMYSYVQNGDISIINTIDYCYAKGDVNGSEYAGGLIGKLITGRRYTSIIEPNNNIIHCYSTSVVIAPNEGGLVGYISSTDSNVVSSSYYSIDKTGCTDIDRGTPLTDESMKLQSSYLGWNFVDVWSIASSVNDGYPYLQTLVPATVVPVTGVTLDKTSLSLTVGVTETLTATVIPDNATNNAVVWESSNEGVATVSDGNITAKSAGTAVITVKTADGGYSAKCTVTVTQIDTTVYVTGITLNKSTLSLATGESSTLTATVAPADATNKTVTWTTSNSSVATVANGVVTAKAAGTATITATTADGGYSAKCTVTVTEKTVDTNAPMVTVSTTKATPGSTVTLTVDLSNNTGFSSLGIEIGYDSSVMTLIGAVNNTAVGCTYTPAQSYAANPYNMSWDSGSNVTYNGNLVTLTFEIAESAADGVYPVTVDYYKGVGGSYKDGYDVNYDENFDSLGLTYTSGNVEVASYTPGDVTGDGAVTTRDGTYLLRYLAGWEIDGIVEAALDVDGSGTVTTRDGTILLRYLAGWDIELK